MTVEPLQDDEIRAVATVNRDPIAVVCAELMRRGRMPSVSELMLGTATWSWVCRFCFVLLMLLMLLLLLLWWCVFCKKIVFFFLSLWWFVGSYVSFSGFSFLAFKGFLAIVCWDTHHFPYGHSGDGAPETHHETSPVLVPHPISITYIPRLWYFHSLHLKNIIIYIPTIAMIYENFHEIAQWSRWLCPIDTLTRHTSSPRWTPRC